MKLLLDRKTIPTIEKLRTGIDRLKQKYPVFYEKLRDASKDMIGRAQEIDEVLSHE